MFKLLINTEIAKINRKFRFKLQKPVNYFANNVKMPLLAFLTRLHGAIVVTSVVCVPVPVCVPVTLCLSFLEVHILTTIYRKAYKLGP